MIATEADDETSVGKGRTVAARNQVVCLINNLAIVRVATALGDAVVSRSRKMHPPSRAITISRATYWISFLIVAVSLVPTTLSFVRRIPPKKLVPRACFSHI